MKTIYNIMLALIGVNNFTNKYLSPFIYIHFTFIILIYAISLYSIYLMFSNNNIFYLVNILPYIRDIVVYHTFTSIEI